VGYVNDDNGDPALYLFEGDAEPRHYEKVAGGTVETGAILRNPKSKLGPDQHPVWKRRIDAEPPDFDSATHEPPRPEVAVGETTIVYGWAAPVEKTAEAIEAAREKERERLRQRVALLDGFERAIVRWALDIENRVRAQAIPTQQPVTPEQFLEALVDLSK